jgi:hypothetical protein
MPITFTKLLEDIEYQLGFQGPSGGLPEVYWQRSIHLEPWAKQAMLEFPLLRPKFMGFLLIGPSHNIELPSDFRSIKSVEFPANQEPPVFISRLNHLEKNFYTNKLVFYDIDLNYTAGTGHVLIFSHLLGPGDEININYLTPHETDLTDNSTDEITVPDEYENVLITYVVAKAYRHLLTLFAVDPTVHENVITEMTEMIKLAEDKYFMLYNKLIEQIGSGESVITPDFTVDKFDRVY